MGRDQYYTRYTMAFKLPAARADSSHRTQAADPISNAVYKFLGNDQ